ncbi:MAG: c-type cytochrome [Planctomyces sp.]|nr:c-type cytochrome [Planctomyces sp.]
MLDLRSTAGWLVLAAVGGLIVVASARADLTPEHRKAAAQVIKDVGQVAGMVRKKELDEADQVLKEAEAKLTSIVDEAQVRPDDRAFANAWAAIGRARRVLDTAREKQAPRDKPMPRGNRRGDEEAVSFVADVAPIITQNCLGCHGENNPRANLRLDTFAGWRRGGRSGVIVVPGNANVSVLARRIAAPNPDQRMPQGQDALSEENIQKIASWINQGARFDGGNENASLADVTAQAALAKFEYPKPKGTETVSFTKDIAPWMANLCGNCHSAQRRSGGLSLVSYFDLMQGGESGELIIPGDKENSRLFRLVGGLELPRMPQGQGRLTRSNYNALVKWFDEGNAYDGDDPRTPLRSFVRSEEDLARERFARMSDEERQKLRIERTEQQFKRALPRDEMQRIESTELLIVGNVPRERLQQTQQWAEEHLDVLRRTFRPEDGALWKGRLALFILKDRFSYDEFNLTINSREAPREMTGHAVVTAADEDAYVVVQDIGDAVSVDSPGLRVNIIDHLTGAFLRRGGASVPNWLARGAGLSLANQQTAGNVWLKALPGQAAPIVATVADPADIFADGTFSPAAVAPVGFTLVNFLLDSGGPARLGQLTSAVRQGTAIGEALQAVYGSDVATLARGYASALRRR